MPSDNTLSLTLRGYVPTGDLEKDFPLIGSTVQVTTEAAERTAKRTTAHELHKQAARLGELAKAVEDLEQADFAVRTAKARLEQLHQDEPLSQDEIEVVTDAVVVLEEGSGSVVQTLRRAFNHVKSRFFWTGFTGYLMGVDWGISGK